MRFALGVMMVLAPMVAMAAEKPSMARVDINATESKIVLKAGAVDGGVTVTQGVGGQTGDTTKQNLSFQMPAVADKWTPMTIKFTPETDGTVTLSLRGQYRKDAEVWIYYDAIQVTGAELKNGDFEEEPGTKEAVAGWSAKATQKPVIVKDEGVPQAGKACVKVSHGNRLAQDITVKAGAEVTITLQAKLDKVAAAK